MFRRIILSFGVAAGISATAQAEECFCLINAQTAAILRACEAYKASNDLYATAVCMDSETGKSSEQTMYPDSGWKQIQAGADRCDPCRRVARGTASETPRGADNIPSGTAK